MAWDEFINAAKQGQLPDIVQPQVKTASVKNKPRLGLSTLSKRAGFSADKLVGQMNEVQHARDMDDWVRKQAFIDASQMPPGGGMPPGGAPPMDPLMGGMPPMDPSMGGGMPPMDPSMGGMPPMDPSMMGGGMPPMDPSMMGGGMPPMDPSMMGGGMPPMDPSMMGGGMPQDPMMGAGGKKMKVEEIIMKETARIKELLHGLYAALGVEVPLSVVDPKDMAAAILEREERKRTEQQVGQTIPGTNTAPIPPLPTKIGSLADLPPIGAANTNAKVQAILRRLNK